MKRLPKVDRVLEWPEVRELGHRHPRTEILKAVRGVLAHLREQARTGPCEGIDDRSGIIAAIAETLTRRTANSLRPIINGSGVVVHTNLGRSPLAPQAEAAMQSVAGGYCNLEYDLEAGSRGKRNAHVESLLCELTGAEAALVVNNNAAAVTLALSSLAANREVVISRGELVEIGGSFRIPDVMRQSGATLVEVGTTNRTHIRDFLAVISDPTALFLKVHTSNFAIVGFTAEASIEEMAALGGEAGIPVMLDAGSGCLIDLSPYGIHGEPTIARHLEDGADIVTFSGDKLLGGPQAGLIVGRKELIEPMKQHPLLRAFRLDKMSLAALEATLRLYRDERLALRDIPTLRMLTMSPVELARRGERIIRGLRRSLPREVSLDKRLGESSSGGGSFPLLHLPTTLIEVRVENASAQHIEAVLRRTTTPVIGRIQHDRFLLDVRTILDRDLAPLAESLAEAAAMLGGERA